MTTLNIRIRALEHNIEIIKSLAADAQIIAVLKGNAYGLGLCKFATFLQARGIRHFAVTELADAIELREKGIFGEILLLTPLYHPEDITRAIKHVLLCLHRRTSRFSQASRKSPASVRL